MKIAWKLRRVGRVPTAELRRLERRLFPADVHEPDDREQWWAVWTPGGRLVAFATACIVGRTCYLTSSGVSRDYRGFGLQSRLIAAREAWASRLGCTTMATHTRYTNIHSLNNLVGRGYRACRPKAVGWRTIEPDFIVLRKRAP